MCSLHAFDGNCVRGKHNGKSGDIPAYFSAPPVRDVTAPISDGWKMLCKYSSTGLDSAAYDHTPEHFPVMRGAWAEAAARNLSVTRTSAAGTNARPKRVQPSKEVCQTLWISFAVRIGKQRQAFTGSVSANGQTQWLLGVGCRGGCCPHQHGHAECKPRPNETLPNKQCRQDSYPFASFVDNSAQPRGAKT